MCLLVLLSSYRGQASGKHHHFTDSKTGSVFDNVTGLWWHFLLLLKHCQTSSLTFSRSLLPGATSAPCLIFIFPAVFYIRIVPKEDEPLRSAPKIMVSFCYATNVQYCSIYSMGITKVLAALNNIHLNASKLFFFNEDLYHKATAEEPLCSLGYQVLIEKELYSCWLILLKWNNVFKHFYSEQKI